MESELLLHIGRCVFRAREAKGWTIRQCAQRAQLSENFWISVEAGDAELDVPTFWKIARALDMRSSELMTMIEKGC